ncbi:hypothetical protein D7Y13_24700 [Corallococcus praedator]|uniref:DUF1828 domain-containing protein n=1 Tax=Corallococcus praedator TaxID=2316724 RepID=A0ABX9QFL4_9BACT|nr:MULTISPECIES: hypothetical protein [Corallococcus]RKH00996.1 hypothetical protein D7X74_38140 [Corallococcus sp. CA047B]RKH25216.1 hypothetical protein D7X75_30495 [Corallococcus sp. CA031C]RKI02425.1 hypothetical protein D7Y13_24700 [Corallococcus praedator]
MSNDRLLLKLLPDEDGDGTAELQVSARSGAFSGESSAWFSLEQLRAFASALTAFPLGEEARRGIAGGTWSFHEADKAYKPNQVFVAISAYPIDTRGSLGVRARLATRTDRAERPESANTAAVELKTTYSALARFSEQFALLLDGRGEEAVLLTDETT